MTHLKQPTNLSGQCVTAVLMTHSLKVSELQTVKQVVWSLAVQALFGDMSRRTDKGAPLRDSLVNGQCTLALISALAGQDISREALTSFKVVRNYVVECATDGEVGR
jgi:hypothetical protein